MNKASSSGVSFFSLLGLLFIGLKLTNYIDWSWWWVLCPFWFPFAFFFCAIIVMFILALVFNTSIRALKNKHFDLH